MYITDKEAIQILRDIVKDQSLAPSRMAISVGKLRELLTRIKPEAGNVSVEDAILHKLYTEKDVSPDGLPMPQIWTFLRGLDRNVSNIVVEKALTSLLESQKIHTIRQGLTFYKYGRDPELEPLPEDTSPES